MEKLNALKGRLETQSSLITALNVEEDLLGMEETVYTELATNMQAIQIGVTNT